MIVRERPDFLRLFLIVRGSVIRRIYPQVLVVMLLSALIVLAHETRPGLVPTFGGGGFALVGIALSVFLAFRNNACYDRWWEARKDWGQLVAVSRDLARQTLLLTARGAAAAAARAAILNLAAAFAYALLGHLRAGWGEEGLARHLDAEGRRSVAGARNPPDLVLQMIGWRLVALREASLLSDIEFALLDGTVQKMAGVLAACERIRNTPVPFGYTLLLHRTAYLFCLLLPFGFADMLGWATPFTAGLVAYTFFGLDALGDELEEPFGQQPNDLPIGAIAETIALDLRAALGEAGLPAPKAPERYILM